MKPTVLFYCLILLLSTSCATLNVNEIRNLDKVEFEPLHLTPDRETNDLRVDLIRQTRDERVNDSVEDTENTPYHPIGFNLGNGLFYDLNVNISLRLDYLFDLSSDSDFEIHSIYRPANNSSIVIRRFSNDTLTLKYPPRDKIHYSYHQVKYDDSIAYMYKKRMNYALIETDSSLVYSGKRRNWDIIRMLDENHYFLDKKMWRINYEKEGNKVLLGRTYGVNLINNNSTIQITAHWRKKTKLLYTIERSKDKIFIYNPKYHGLKMELEQSKIKIFRDKTLGVIYELKGEGSSEL